MVHLRPVSVVKACLGVDGAVDMIQEAELPESQLEQGAPRGIVGVVRVKGFRHTVTDVE
jgi:hypothetical protein